MENEEMTPTSEVCAVPLSVLRFGPVRFGTVRSNAVRMMSLSVMKDVAITEPKVSRPTCVTELPPWLCTLFSFVEMIRARPSSSTSVPRSRQQLH